jgi:predicted RNA-binding Zn ribbon-like protein
VDALAAHWRERPRQAAGAFEEALALREAIYRIFGARAGGTSPAVSDVKALNAALARAPTRDQLHRTREGFSGQVERPRPEIAHLLAPVLWSAGDLLVGPKLAKVRACANEKCQWLFLDDSKSGTRRWCSMSMCGNRAKAHRHYARQKHG